MREDRSGWGCLVRQTVGRLNGGALNHTHFKILHCEKWKPITQHQYKWFQAASMLHCILPSTNNYYVPSIYGGLIPLKRKLGHSHGISLVSGKEWHTVHQETFGPALTWEVTFSHLFPLQLWFLLPHIRTLKFPGRSNILHLNEEDVYLCCCLLFHYSFLFSCLKLFSFSFSRFFLLLLLGWLLPSPPSWLFSFLRSVSAYFLPHYLSTCKLAMLLMRKQFFKLVKMYQRQTWRILPLLDSSWF